MKEKALENSMENKIYDRNVFFFRSKPQSFPVYVMQFNCNMASTIIRIRIKYTYIVVEANPLMVSFFSFSFIFPRQMAGVKFEFHSFFFNPPPPFPPLLPLPTHYFYSTFPLNNFNVTWAKKKNNYQNKLNENSFYSVLVVCILKTLFLSLAHTYTCTCTYFAHTLNPLA